VQHCVPSKQSSSWKPDEPPPFLHPQFCHAVATLNNSRTSSAPARRPARTAAPSVGLPALDGPTTLAALQASHELVLLLDANGRVEQVWGADEALQQAARHHWVGRDWSATVTAECLDKVAQMLRDASTSSARSRQVNHVLPGRGEWPVLYTPVRLEGNERAAQVLALGRDLSGLVHAQQRMVQAQQAMERDVARLRDAQARYRHLFQHSSEAVLAVDAQTYRTLEANPAAARLLALPPAKLIDQPMTALFAPEDEAALRQAAARALRLGEPQEAVHCTLRKAAAPGVVWISAFAQDGAQYLLLRLLAQAAHDGLESGAAGARAKPHNGYERLAAFDAAASAQALYANYWQLTRDAVVFADAQGRVEQSNPAFARLVDAPNAQALQGQSLERWLGRTGVELGVLLGQLRGLAEGQSTGVMATELRSEQGSVLPVQVHASVLQRPKHSDARYVFCLREDAPSAAAPVAGDALSTSHRIPRSSEQLAALIGRVPLKQIVAESNDLIERLSIQSALHVTRDNRVLAAQLLGLSRQSLYVKMRRFGLGDLPSLEQELAEQAQAAASQRAPKKTSGASGKTVKKAGARRAVAKKTGRSR
jgi:transcriptional regulator PpsR